MNLRLALLALTVLPACGEADPVGLPVLGAGLHTAASVRLSVLADASDGLADPSDLSFNLRAPDQLWITNYGSDSITRLEGNDYGDSWVSGGLGQDHFLRRPMGIAFSDFGNFATAQDTDELTQGTFTPEDFMGPTLWDDSFLFDGAHASHLDMLHNSPLGGGIAWEDDNIYWVFDGYHSSLTRYDFNEDHGYGGADHSDGVIARYVEGEVARIEGIPSSLAMDRNTGLLYAADTANNRIVVLDTSTGTRGTGSMGPDYDGGTMYKMDGAELRVLVDGNAPRPKLDDKGQATIRFTPMEQPSGLELVNGMLFVSDHAASRIYAFDLAGNMVDWVQLELPAGSLGGIAVDPAGRIVVTNMNDDQVLRIESLDFGLD